MIAKSLDTGDPRLFHLDAVPPGAIDPGVVGAKAAALMRLGREGLAIPPGFVLGTEVCARYHENGRHLDEEVIGLLRQGIMHIERGTGLCFGADRRPLLVAVRSGAAVSMPGMLDTVLNVGLCDVTLPGLLRATGDPSFCWDSYRRLIESYAEVVEGCAPAPFRAVVDDELARHGLISASELDAAALRDVVSNLKDLHRAVLGRAFPQDPMEQLLGAVEAVLRSWNSARAVEYRRLEGITGLVGTAVTVQAMVFGNRGVTSGSGVGFTRDPATGSNQLYIDFVLNAQGEDVVGGRHGAGDPEPLIAAVPGLANKLEALRGTLEAVFGDVQDFEFTVEDSKLWLLQTRSAKRTPWAALQIACDLVSEGILDPGTALDRLREYDLERISRTRLAPGLDIQPLGRATPAGIGVAVGGIALDADAARRCAERGESVILVREQTSTDDIAALAVCRGLLTGSGTRTSHAAVVARQLGVVCLVNCTELSIDPHARTLRIGGTQLGEHDTITVDGSDGYIYAGELQLVEEYPIDLLEQVRGWQQAGSRRM